MSHTVPKRRDGDADDLSVDLSVGIDDRRQVTPDQHHGLSAKRRYTMLPTQPAPFPTELALHLAAKHANSMNARVYAPDRPVSSKSRRPAKAEWGVQFIARDPDHLVRSVQWGHPALWRESAGQRGPKLALVVVLRSRSAWTSRTSTLDARGRDLRVLRGCTTARDRTESVSRYEYQS